MFQLFESVRQNCRPTSLSVTPNIKRAGFIVVETNYRVYAYTESPLQIALITLFIELNYRFPKFVVGFITRDSVRTAFKNGITAKQITHYLTMHAHSKMTTSNRSTVIPSTIIDQIFLWEQERNRLSFTEGVLYSQFTSYPDYELLRKYAHVSLFIWPWLRFVAVRSHNDNCLPFPINNKHTLFANKLGSILNKFQFQNLLFTRFRKQFMQLSDKYLDYRMYTAIELSVNVLTRI